MTTCTTNYPQPKSHIHGSPSTQLSEPSILTKSIKHRPRTSCHLPLWRDNPFHTSTASQLCRGERRRVCGDTGMTEMGRATAAYGHAGVTEMGCETGIIYSGDPGVDKSRLISSHYTTKYTPYLFQLLISLALSEISWIRAIVWVLKAGWYNIFAPSSYTPRARTTLSHPFPLQCREMCGGVLMMASMPSSSTVSPQMGPKRRFWFGKLSPDQ